MGVSVSLVRDVTVVFTQRKLLSAGTNNLGDRYYSTKFIAKVRTPDYDSADVNLYHSATERNTVALLTKP